MGSVVSMLFGMNTVTREEQEFQKSLGAEPIRIWLIGELKSGKATLIARLAMSPLTHSTSKHSLTFETCNVQISSKVYAPNEIPCSANISNLYNPDGIIYLFQNDRSIANDEHIQKSIQDILEPPANYANNEALLQAYKNVPLLILANHKTTWFKLPQQSQSPSFAVLKAALPSPLVSMLFKDSENDEPNEDSKDDSSSISPRDKKQNDDLLHKQQMVLDDEQITVRMIVKSRELMCRTLDELLNLFQNQIKLNQTQWFVQPVCIYTGEGVYQALEWICQVILVNRLAANKVEKEKRQQ